MYIEKKFKPNVLDVFCGAGGMSLGFQNAGCRILGGIDLNPHAIRTHHKNFPDVSLRLPATDIRDIQDLSTLEIDANDVDILIGGPPCQVFSRVGIGKMRHDLKRDIEKDHRNFLYQEYVRFLKYYKPRCFVMENVDYLKNKTEIFKKITSALEGCGYELKYRVLDASHFGVPQKRLRLFIVGIRSDLGLQPSFPDQKTQTSISVKEAISDLPNLKAIAIPLKSRSSGPKQKDREVKYKTEPRSSYQEEMRRDNQTQYVWNHLCRAHNYEDLKIFSMLKQGEKYIDLPEEVRRYRDDIFEDKYKRLIWNKPAWTLTAHMRKDCLAYIHPTQTRSISVREAARIQSFPDDFVFDAPMTRMFELVGNSVPPLLAQAVAVSVLETLQIHYQSCTVTQLD